ncbi:MFS transporter [Hyphomicrobium sp. D-2]|uniref:MFS transporter n=1 Tax=Hyphomicrobium sp. D-2 TaxID=3041621 RepID=UPI00245604AD|nr:MFS transporter [Hyphomicrobium sp. D-2]MDH4982361.1 MFS transporter [Hyphomicrobium sp. D-2]
MQPARTRRAIGAGMIGNVLEWYDFAIYGFFAVEIGRQFFPHESQVAQLLATFGVFAVGYLMRPLGGIAIGHVSDHYGRRAALIVAITAMAVPTFLIGLLPGYAVLGIAAPILLTMLRMVQGLSLGGEHPSSMVFLVERAPENRRGFMGGLAACGAIVGLLLGSATGALLAAVMSADALAEWGWRIPFIMGLGVGLVGNLIRRNIEETVPERTGKSPAIVDTLRNHWRLVGRIAALAAFNAVPFYLLFVYLVSVMELDNGFTPAQALLINTISMTALLPCMLLGAWLTDKVGRKPVLLFSIGMGFLTAWPLFTLMHQPDPVLVFAGQLGAALFVGLFTSSFPALIVESTPAPVRCTAVALGYNLSIGIVGGLTPFIATLLVAYTDNPMAPAFMVMFAAAVAFTAVLTFKETLGQPLEGGMISTSHGGEADAEATTAAAAKALREIAGEATGTAVDGSNSNASGDIRAA